MTFSSAIPTLSSPEQTPDSFEKCFSNALTAFSKICTSIMMLSFYSRVLNHWESPNACQIACKLFQTNGEARLCLSILCRWRMTYLPRLMDAAMPENPRPSQSARYLTLRSMLEVSHPQVLEVISWGPCGKWNQSLAVTLSSSPAPREMANGAQWGNCQYKLLW